MSKKKKKNKLNDNMINNNNTEQSNFENEFKEKEEHTDNINKPENNQNELENHFYENKAKEISINPIIKEEINKNKIEENFVKTTEEVKENQLKKTKNKKVKSRSKFYFGYCGRMAILSTIAILLLVSSIIFALNIFDISKEDYINYSEKSDIDYKVYLKENSFYDDEFLVKDRVYVASLIDEILIDFSYKFSSEKNIDTLFKYDITAKLLITDINDQNIFYEKNYELLSEKEISIENKNSKTIMESIKINYDKYNKIANSFKTNYGLNTNSKLVIYFNIENSFTNEENKFVDNSRKNMSLEIPLSEKSIEIELNSKDINNDNKILLNEKDNVRVNATFIVLFILTIILLALVLLKLNKYIKCLFIKVNVYDNYINKILSDYDRLIVKTKTAPIRNQNDKDNIIEVENFEELLDARDNLKQPIMYYVITKHIKSQFYIKNECGVYITTIKRVDLEGDDEKI